MGMQLLRDAEIFPSDEVLKAVLGDSYPVYEEFLKRIGAPQIHIDLEWRYYNDGKAWLGKAVFKKKTVFWVSVWEGSFKTTFYFTEKNRGGIEDLSVSPDIKSRIKNETPMGKLIPLVFEISKMEQLEDLVAIAIYKKDLK